MKRGFADTSYFIALVAPNDIAHAQAVLLANEPRSLITTAWVMSELAAYFSRPPNRELFGSLLAALRSDPKIKFVPATAELFDRGVDLYAARSDKSWSLVDCISFVVIQREELTDALTTDHHFIQAGFNALFAEANK